MNIIKVWMAQIRANFLLLAVLLVFTGLSAVIKYNTGSLDFSWLNAILIAIGVISAHISVNLFNEYSDYNTKIDFNTIRTPFSGGTGMIISGYTTPRQVISVAIITLIIAFITGVYFAIVSHWIILVIAVFGVFTIIFYTTLLARFMLGELFSGLALGSLVVIGTYIAMTATPGIKITMLVPLQVILISIPPGILTSLLLLLNEFPDLEADKKGGRYHMLIHFGKKKAAWIYTAGVIATYSMIAMIPIMGFSSYWLLLALATLPLGVKAAIITILNHDDPNKMVKAIGINVAMVLTTNLVIAIALLL